MNCIKCQIEIYGHWNKRYCGNIKVKTGCAYKRHLETNIIWNKMNPGKTKIANARYDKSPKGKVRKKRYRIKKSKL